MNDQSKNPANRPGVIRLRCPCCKATKLALNDPEFPVGTAEVHCLCPDCGPAVLFKFFNAEGNRIHLT